MEGKLNINQLEKEEATLFEEVHRLVLTLKQIARSDLIAQSLQRAIAARCSFVVSWLTSVDSG